MKVRISSKSISLLMFFLLSITSCNDNFLDVPVQGGVSTTSDPDLARKLVTGVYNSLMLGDSWGKGDVHGFAFVALTNIMSDDGDKGSFPGDQLVVVGDLDNFKTSTTNQFCETIWGGHYIAIGAANQALKALKPASIDDELKAQLIGETKFLRAYLYFNLIRMFGAVPLVLRVPIDADDANSAPVFRTRAELSVVYDSIIQDLEFSVNHLAVRSQSETGHATKGAAQGLLAKVYMYKASDPAVAAPGDSDWQQVFDLTDAVIASSEYGLIPDYAAIWRQANDNKEESLFEIETGYFNNDNLKIDNYTSPQGPRAGGSGGWNDLGWGFNTPSQSLLDAYEPGDIRKAGTVIFIDDTGTHAGTILWDGFRIPSSDSVENLYYNYKAYTSKDKETYVRPTDKDRGKNIRILRYADVLLMYAEAAVKLGTGNPDEKINLLRDRADLLPLTGVTREQVWQERRVELAMEHDRFWDIVRQGRIVPGRTKAAMDAAGKTNYTEGKHELLPIPNTQILLSNFSLIQNPNY
jgi:starch-binding outer membrane protein, SusD/RagB family